MDILKNDVTAILGQIFDMKLQENKRHSTMTPGLDKNGYHFYIIYIRFSESKNLRKISLSKNQKSFRLEHQESDFRERNLQCTLVL